MSGRLQTDDFEFVVAFFNLHAVHGSGLTGGSCNRNLFALCAKAGAVLPVLVDCERQVRVRGNIIIHRFHKSRVRLCARKLSFMHGKPQQRHVLFCVLNRDRGFGILERTVLLIRGLDGKLGNGAVYDEALAADIVAPLSFTIIIDRIGIDNVVSILGQFSRNLTCPGRRP